MMSSDWAAVITLTASFFTVFVAGISVGYKIGKSQKKQTAVPGKISSLL